MTDGPSEDTERLLHEQGRRAEQESELAEESQSPEERKEHQRRADKAESLHEKLREQREAD